MNTNQPIEFNKAKYLILEDTELNGEDLIATVERWENEKKIFNKRGNLNDKVFFDFCVARLTELKLSDPDDRLREQMSVAKTGIEDRTEKDSLANLNRKRKSSRVIDRLTRNGCEWIVAETTPY
ncbi:MAG: hypothetical protein HQ477_02000, partial [Chloroflexi bacterium]|nr:hypothetical protein [Chloroflexota bacterium]